MALNYIRDILIKTAIGLKWIGFGIISGIVVGAVSGIFAKLIGMATVFRLENGWIILLMPIAGMMIVYYYHLLGADNPKGTNLVIESLRDKKRVPVSMAPLIIVSTVVTHLFGGSVGREGAALQVGASLGNALGRLLRFKEEDRRRVLMCGMSAAFSALFGTPMAAAVMAMEISTVGIMYYGALVPCVVSALMARLVAEAMGVKESVLTLPEVPEFNLLNGGWTLLLAFLCAGVAVLFVVIMHKTKNLMKKYLPNPYIRAAAAGAMIIAMTFLVGDQTYNGTGSAIIDACMTDPLFRIVPYAFLLKMLFTAVTLSGGFQGGEIVPSLFIGAAFGNLFSQLTGFPSQLSAAIGMAAVFCGVTNCPIAALLISFEMFGFSGGSYFMLAIAITYLYSGNFGIYSAQGIRYDRFFPTRINRKEGNKTEERGNTQ